MKKKNRRGRVGGSWTLVTGEEEGEGWRDESEVSERSGERERKREREKKARVAMVTKLLITFI